MMRKRLMVLITALPVLLFSAAIANSAIAAVNIELVPKPNPPEAGENAILIKVADESGKPVKEIKVEMIAYMPAMGTMPYMEEKTQISKTGDGQYTANLTIPMGGTWEITLNLDINGSVTKYRYSLTTGISGIANKNSSVPSTSSADSSTATTLLDIGPARLQKIGVRFAEAKRQAMKRSIEAVGIVEQDQTHREEVTLRFSGYVAKQFRGRVGDTVRAGEPLFSIYSPDLMTAQNEFLLADKATSEGHSLYGAAADKLKNLGLSGREIEQIRSADKPKRDVVIRSNISGSILEIGTREGAAVNAGQVVYVIGDLSKSFIVARVFQQDISSLKVGQTAEVQVPGLDGEVLHGTIGLIYPQVAQGAGTANVRVEVSEPNPNIRPGAYADIRFPVDLGNVLFIPSDAILYSGRHRYVFVDRGQGNLEPREVETGRASDGHTEIRSGLQEGDRVAASGTFLLGSEAQLRSALPKWKDAGTQEAEKHQSGAHK